MGIRVKSFDGHTLVLRAPLKPNSNDKGTGFAGSLYSLAVLTGWGLLTLKIRESGIQARTVIHKSKADFVRPATAALEARCSLASPLRLSRCLQQVARGKRTAVTLSLQVTFNSKPCLLFTGRYVIYPEKKDAHENTLPEQN